MAISPKMRMVTISPNEATLLWDRSEVPYASHSVVIQNQSSSDNVRIGDSNVSANNGLILIPGAFYSTTVPRQELYGYCTNTVTVCILFEVQEY